MMAGFTQLMLVVLHCMFAQAGGFVASGGNLVGDSSNPWWIQSKSQVRYCIDISQAEISAPPHQIETVVRATLANWRREWSSFYGQGNQSQFQVGTYGFTKVHCEDDHDLAFYFGWNSLDSKSQTYIAENFDVDTLVGLALRTEYDVKDLSGKGLIYIASDLGGHRFSSPSSQIGTPWQHPFLLSGMLAHELGHVFGLRHSNLFSGLMSENFPESLLDRKHVSTFESSGLLESPMAFSFFGRDRFFSINEDSLLAADAERFFRLVGIRDLALRNHPQCKTCFDIVSMGDSSATPVFRFESAREFSEAKQPDGLVLHLTPDQRIFAPISAETNWESPLNYTFSMAGTFRNPATGSSFAAFLSGDRMTISLVYLAGTTLSMVPFKSQFLNLTMSRRTSGNSN